MVSRPTIALQGKNKRMIMILMFFFFFNSLVVSIRVRLSSRLLLFLSFFSLLESRTPLPNLLFFFFFPRRQKKLTFSLLLFFSSATVSQECITAYNVLKLSKKYKYIIFKLSDDFKQIVIEDASTDKDWENFREKLVNSTTKSKSVSFFYGQNGWSLHPVFLKLSLPPLSKFEY